MGALNRLHQQTEGEMGMLKQGPVVRSFHWKWTDIVVAAFVALSVGIPLGLIAWQRNNSQRAQASSGMPIPGDSVAPHVYTVDLDAPPEQIASNSQEPAVVIE